MLIGYARVSATHQNLDRQLAVLKAARCRKIFREKLSGREGVKRPQLEKAIDALGPGDVLVLAEWDRATRSMMDGIRIIERVAARKASLKALDRQWLESDHALGQRHPGFPLGSCRRRAGPHPGARQWRSGSSEKEGGEVRPQAEAGCPPAEGGGPHGSCGGAKFA